MEILKQEILRKNYCQQHDHAAVLEDFWGIYLNIIFEYHFER